MAALALLSPGHMTFSGVILHKRRFQGSLTHEYQHQTRCHEAWCQLRRTRHKLADVEERGQSARDP